MSERFTLHSAPAAQSELTDSQREDFLRALDKAAEVNVTDFEASFIARYLNRPSMFIWTGPRRHVADEMMKRYAHRLPSRPSDIRQIQPACPGHCGYFILGTSGRQERCNQAATHRNDAGAEFCTAHWQQRTEWLERKRQINTRR